MDSKKTSISSFAESISPIITNCILPPIIEYLFSTHNIKVTIEDLSSILNLPIQSRTISSLPAINNVYSVPTQQVTVSKSRSKQSNSVPAGEGCIYIPSRGKNAKAKISCNKPRIPGQEYCNSCFKKRGGGNGGAPRKQQGSTNRTTDTQQPILDIPSELNNSRVDVNTFTHPILEQIEVFKGKKFVRSLMDGFVIDTDETAVHAKFDSVNNKFLQLTQDDKDQCNKLALKIAGESPIFEKVTSSDENSLVEKKSTLNINPTPFSNIFIPTSEGCGHILNGSKTPCGKPKIQGTNYCYSCTQELKRNTQKHDTSDPDVPTNKSTIKHPVFTSLHPGLPIPPLPFSIPGLEPKH